MTKHVNEKFTKEPIAFDGNDYDGCQFDECEIVYSGGTLPKLTNNSFKNCGWAFDDAAARTIQFMTGLYAGGARELIEGTLENIRGKKKPGITMH